MESNNKYLIGTRVRVVEDIPTHIGKVGTVVGYVLGYKENLVIVELDEPYRYMQNLKTGRSYLSGTRYYLEGAIEELS